MNTMVEIGTTRILWRMTPVKFRDAFYPGSDMVPVQTTVPKSLDARAVYCMTYTLRLGGCNIGVTLTEVP